MSSLYSLYILWFFDIGERERKNFQGEKKKQKKVDVKGNVPKRVILSKPEKYISQNGNWNVHWRNLTKKKKGRWVVGL